jgi:hypothetical protein
VGTKSRYDAEQKRPRKFAVTPETRWDGKSFRVLFVGEDFLYGLLLLSLPLSPDSIPALTLMHCATSRVFHCFSLYFSSLVDLSAGDKYESFPRFSACHDKLVAVKLSHDDGDDDGGEKNNENPSFYTKQNSRSAAFSIHCLRRTFG